MGNSSVKVEGGKLVEIEVTGSEVWLTGDFFLEPPEARREIEEKLEGLERNVSKEEILNAVKSVDAKLIGFSAEDVAEVFMEASRQ